MENHWVQSSEWESLSSDQEMQGQNGDNHPTTNSGSYHCKSALRDHESNMKLFLYKSSYNKLAALVGRYPYNDEALLLLPDLWNCFYHGTYSLGRSFDVAEAKVHSEGSPAFLRWVDYTLSQMTTGELLDHVLIGESSLWGLSKDTTRAIMSEIYHPTMCKVRRCLYLQYFLGFALIILNFEDMDVRSDVRVTLPGICDKVEDGIYQLKFNNYLWLYITPHAVFVHTPVYSQILQKDLFLNLCDKVSERINVVIGSRTISHLTQLRFPLEKEHPDLGLDTVVEDIIKWGDHLLYNLRNKAFDLIGMYEAFCVSAILLGDDPLIWNNREFQDNLLADVAANEPSLYNGAQSLVNMINKLSPSNLSEIHGLWRIWGHPIIDLEGGLKKMEATCLKQSPVDVQETEIGHRTFKYIFARNYLNKHHHYPLSNMSSAEDFELYRDHLQQQDRDIYAETSAYYSEDVYIHKCLRSNVPLDEYDVRYRHSDWESVQFLQNFQIPQSVNLATMIKDKAISQTRSELISSVMLRNSVFDPRNRRGVLKWLSEQTLKLKNFLGMIDDDGIPENDRIIGLYPKERELKTKARFFSLMSYKMRMYVTATEEILGKYLLPYFPMITMSDTLLNMIIRLYNMTTKIGARGSTITYSMNIDFSKWNQNMRERTNASIFSEIDKIIGFRRLISRTHDIFRNSYLYLCSGEYIPQIIRGALTAMSPWSRIGDESGKEGLRQKGWTITTVCDIVSLAFSHGVKIELIGGGDNQVLTVTISSRGTERSLSSEEQRTSIRERMVKFRNSLAKKMSKRGLPLKLEETWISHKLLMYNKIMYLDGVPLPSRLKVISRMFSNSNEGILCLGGIMSTLGTGYQSLSSKDYDPILSWIMSRWLTLLNLSQYYSSSPMAGAKHLDRAMLQAYSRRSEGENLFGPSSADSRPRKNKDHTSFTPKRLLSLEELFLICLYYHKVLGGPGIGSPLSYIMKGFPDPLAEALTFNYYMMKSEIPAAMKDKIACLTSVMKSPIKHWEHLLEDPVAVNHNAPSHGIAALRNQASEVMKSTEIKNQAFRELISIGDTEYLRDLSKQLCAPDSIEPRLLHDVVGSTIPGYVNTILSKVDQSTTLNKLASNTDVVGCIYNSEMHYMMFLAEKVKIKIGHQFGDCPTEDARGLRNLTWGKNIVGVTTPHPAAYLTMVDHNNTAPECDHNYISVLVKRTHPLHHHRRGQFRPYFGSYTAEKFKSGVLTSAYGDEDILRRALKIQKLLGWRYKAGSNMYTIIQGILSCVTNADPSKFLPTIEEITGDVEHRYHDMATKHGGIPSNLTRDLTYVSCNTSTFTDHSKGAANETIHFQAAIIYCSVYASLVTAGAPRASRVLHFHEKCKECIKKIEHVEDDGEGLHGISLASCPNNPLMYIEEKDIPVHYHNVLAFEKEQAKLSKCRERLGEGKKMIQFEICKERSSWLLLAYVSLLSGNMKGSAENLTMQKMSRHELVFLVRCSVHLNMLRQAKPPAGMTVCDIRDAVDIWESLYKKILATNTIINHLKDSGSPVASNQDNVVLLISVLLENTSDVEVRLLEGAVCKYQDPEYKTSRLISILVKVPSARTCHLCCRQWHSWALNDTVAPCNIHMQNPPNLEYHMYSLDKLSRFAGLAKSPTDEPSNKRKQATLFASIKRHKASDRTHTIRMRLSRFLYQESKVEKTISDHLACRWKKMNIMEEDDVSSFKIRTSEGFSTLREFGVDYVPTTVGVTVNMVQTMMVVLASIGEGSDRKKKIGIEVTGETFQLGVLRKSCLMLRNLLVTTDIQAQVVLYVSSVHNLEEVNLTALREIEYDLRVSGLSSGGARSLSVVQHGEGALDISAVARECDAIILSGTRDIGLITQSPDCRVFVSATSDDCYCKIAEIKEQMAADGLALTLKLSTPEESVSFPYPCVIIVENSASPYYVSYDMTLRSLDTLRPVYNANIGANLLNNINEETSCSIAYELYKEYVGTPTPIMSKNIYESCRSKLAAGLMLFALKSNRKSSMPWRTIKLLSLIIGLDILTSTNKPEMLASYSNVCGTSFSRLTYKEVILYRKGDMPNHHGSLINWTVGSLGEDIVTTVRALDSRLVCPWSDLRSPSRKVCI
uniref:RNA-directed RNA polymerase n=1 Tax=Sambucus betanucleorhabdovirus 2 TaxID=3141830 RepID=A0AAU7E1A0_9RHAB